MKTNAIPSLGDEGQVKARLINEERPLPPSRKEIVSVFEHILEMGGVQRVVVELGRPIKFSRLVKDDLSPIESLERSDLLASIRNGEVREFSPGNVGNMHEYLFKAFALLAQGRLKARAFLASDFNLFRESLGVDDFFDLSTIYGVEAFAYSVNDVPDDVILLAATPQAGEDVVLTLKLMMFVPKGAKK